MFTVMGPKRVITPEERERRREYQSQYRAQKRKDPTWRASEVARTSVIVILFRNLFIANLNKFIPYSKVRYHMIDNSSTYRATTGYIK
jgi:hypothetical protein